MNRISPASIRLLLFLPLAGCHASQPEHKSQAERTLPVVTTNAERGDVAVAVESVGTVQANFMSVVRPRVDGLLTEVLFQEGQKVASGQLLARLDRRPFAVALAQAEGQLQRDRAQLDNATLMLGRDRSLRQNSLIAQQAVDDQNALLGQAQGTVAYDAAARDSAKLQLSYTEVRAPIAGRIGLRRIDPGNLVGASDPNGLALITQVDPIAVVFSLPSDLLPDLQKALAADQLTVTVRSQSGGPVLAEGRVTVIDNLVNLGTGTLKLKALFANPNEALWPNLFVRVEAQILPLHNAVTVPAAAVAYGSEAAFVMTVDATNHAHKHVVEVVRIVGERAVVKGLVGQESIVLEGQHRLRDGDAVAVSPKADTQALEAPGRRPQ